MRFVISHVYSKDNKGDAAILAAQIQELRRVSPDCEMTVLTIDRITVGETFDGCQLVNALMYQVTRSPHAAWRVVVAATMVPLTLVWCVVRSTTGARLPLPRDWRQALDAVDGADAQVCVGGGYLRGLPNFRSTFMLLLLLHQVLVARLLRKRVYLYAQSFGPLYGPVQRFLFRRAIRAADLVMPREETSAALIQSMAPSARNFRVADTAFLFASDSVLSVRELWPVDSDGLVVGLTVREWLAADKQSRYEAAISALIEHATGMGCTVVVIPQVTSTHHGDDDRVVGRRLARAHTGNDRLVVVDDDSLDHHATKALYSSLDVLVGTRFHSVIFALSCYVPAMAVEYEHKTSGILRDLGLDDWYLPMDGLTSNATITMFDRLVAGRIAYEAHLRELLPAYILTARLGAELIERDLSKPGRSARERVTIA